MPEENFPTNTPPQPTAPTVPPQPQGPAFPSMAPVQPELEKKEVPIPKRRSPFIFILFLLFLIALAGAGYYGFMYYKEVSKPSPTPTTEPTPVATTDPTADWKIYINPSWKISFKYPQTWTDLKLEGSESYVSKDSSNIINLTINKGIYYNDKPLDPYSSAFSASIGQKVGEENEKIKIADLEIDGRDAVVVSMDYLQSTQEPPSYSYIYIIKDNNSLFILNFWSQDGDKSKTNIMDQKETFDQILSTFKFIDKETDTSNWKTYTNTKYKYSFKYPTLFIKQITDPSAITLLSQDVGSYFEMDKNGVFLAINKVADSKEIADLNKILSSQVNKELIFDQPKNPANIIEVLSVADSNAVIYHQKDIDEKNTDYSYSCVFKNKDNYFLVFLSGPSGNKEYNLSLLKQILSTLKFTS